MNCTFVVSIVTFATVFFSGLVAYPRARRPRAGSVELDHLIKHRGDVDPRSVPEFVPTWRETR